MASQIVLLSDLRARAGERRLGRLLRGEGRSPCRSGRLANPSRSWRIQRCVGLSHYSGGGRKAGPPRASEPRTEQVRYL